MTARLEVHGRMVIGGHARVEIAGQLIWIHPHVLNHIRKLEADCGIPVKHPFQMSLQHMAGEVFRSLETPNAMWSTDGDEDRDVARIAEAFEALVCDASALEVAQEAANLARIQVIADAMEEMELENEEDD